MQHFIRCFLLLFCAVFSVSAADDGLIGRWSFDNDLPGLVKNSVNELFNAKISQEFPRVDGVHGKAIDLSGSYQIEIPADFVPSGLTELTFSAWVAPRHLNGYVEIIRKEDANGPVQNRLLLAFQNSGQFLTLGLNIGGNYSECDAVITPEEILDGHWHFVTGTFDGKFMHVYLDGQEIGSYEHQSSQINTSADFRPLTQFWHVEYGNWKTIDSITINAPGFIGSSNGQSEFFNGKLDEVCFYNRALSPGEIYAAYSVGKPVKNKTIDAAEETAKKWYVKAGSYRTTLLATREKVANAGKLDSAVLVTLHRVLRNDYPNEVNSSIVKHQRSPIELMTW
ncbi:MAG: LamG domain-containing protein, partial [Planctomycetaceae bacterium]|nr:LamG domain-containing protein [Planctomycetaceae bacterium]